MTAGYQRLVPWLVGAVVLTITVATLFLTVQQIDRQSSDDQPQRLATQLAILHDLPEPGAADLVDLGGSDALFWVAYDASGSPQAGTGYFDGGLAQLPKGVIDTAGEQGRNSVTWEPRDGLRFATVEVAQGDRIVMAGQSLEPSERRTRNVGLLLLLCWAVGLVVLGAGAVITRAGRGYGGGSGAAPVARGTSGST
jgi:hypothetical protein